MVAANFVSTKCSGFGGSTRTMSEDRLVLPRRLTGSVSHLRENLARADSDMGGPTHLSQCLRSADRTA